MTNYVLVAPNDLIARELRRFIIGSNKRTGIRYTQVGNTFNVSIDEIEAGWTPAFLNRWRTFITDRWGV